MRYLFLRFKRFCGYLTGFVFLIGGLLKLMDPVGAGLVMKEYLAFLHLGFLAPLSKALGYGFALIESIIGIALITGVWRKIFALAALALQAIFLCLTALLLIFNPEMDCGCFGEAIHLTHLQTFLKNVALCALLALYSFPLRHIGQHKKRKLVSFGIVSLSVLVFSIYSLTHLPLVDFTEYKPASVLRAADSALESYEDMYQTWFIYEKDGRIEHFDLENLPDSTWTFVDTDTMVLTEGQNNHFIDLSIYDSNGTYVDSLAAKGRVIIKSIYKPYKSAGKWEKVSEFINEAREAGFTPLILSVPDGEIKNAEVEDYLYYSDYKTLITLNRSNGGVTYFHDGVLIKKWASKHTPDLNTLEGLTNDDITEIMIWQESRGSIMLQCFLLYIFAIMLLL